MRLSGRLLPSAFLLLPCLLASQPAAANFLSADTCQKALQWSERIVGAARDIRSGALRYTEHYHYPETRQISYVNYRTPAGDMIVQKLLDGRRSPIAPNYYAVDTRLQRLTIYREDEDKAYWGVIPDDTFCKNREPGQLNQQLYGRSARSDASSRFIVDAGFDAYVARHWQALHAGDEQQIDFATSDKRGKVRLTIKRIASDDCGARLAAVPGALTKPVAIEDTVCFKLSSKNWLVNRIVKPIYLVYGSQDRRLYYFYGLTNIPTQEGKRQRLLISYRYMD